MENCSWLPRSQVQSFMWKWLPSQNSLELPRRRPETINFLSLLSLAPGGAALGHWPGMTLWWQLQQERFADIAPWSCRESRYLSIQWQLVTTRIDHTWGESHPQIPRHQGIFAVGYTNPNHSAGSWQGSLISFSAVRSNYRTWGWWWQWCCVDPSVCTDG